MHTLLLINKWSIYSRLYPVQTLIIFSTVVVNMRKQGTIVWGGLDGWPWNVFFFVPYSEKLLLHGTQSFIYHYKCPTVRHWFITDWETYKIYYRCFSVMSYRGNATAKGFTLILFVSKNPLAETRLKAEEYQKCCLPRPAVILLSEVNTRVIGSGAYVATSGVCLLH